MKNTFGKNIALTLFGESHGEAIGAVLDGMPAGIKVDTDFIKHQLALRRPAGNISTKRREKDEFSIISGVLNGFTTGSPITIIIPNKDVKSKDYEDMDLIPRPSHADFTAHIKYGGFEDRRGGGHFSGRITAAVVAVCAIIISALKNKDILIGTHIAKCGGINDREFCDYSADIAMLNGSEFAVLDDSKAALMKEKIEAAANELDSIGGVLETAVIGMPAGVGEPFFDTVEGCLSKVLFAIPAVKGVEFGAGFSIADMLGSEANDQYCLDGNTVKTKTNNSGGILGGITSGMPIIFRTAIKPTPTIARQQVSVNLSNMTEVNLSAKGRHDPAIVHRARVVADSMAALALADLLTLKFGTDWLVK